MLVSMDLLRLLVLLLCSNFFICLWDKVVLVVIMLFILLFINEVVMLVILLLLRFGVILINKGMYLLWVCVKVFCVVFSFVSNVFSVVLYCKFFNLGVLGDEILIVM